MTYKKREPHPPVPVAQKIPQIAHFYWGNKIMPYLRYLSVKSFAKFNPNWKVKLYVPENPNDNKTWGSLEQKYEITAKDYWPRLLETKDANIEIIPFDAASIGYSNDLPEVQKSDLLRWSLLSTVGGLWSDMDILYFKSMNGVIRGNPDTCICCHEFHSIGFMLGASNDSFYKEVFDACRGANMNDYQGVGNQILTAKFGWHHGKIMGRLRRQRKTLYNIPMNVVYPITEITTICEAKLIDRAMKMIKPSTIGIHWYAGHPMLAEYVSNMVPETLDQYGNVLGHFARQIQIS